MDTDKASGKEGETLKVSLKMKLDRSKEWKQMFEETWRYEKDYFYAPNMHGRDWDVVYKRLHRWFRLLNTAPTSPTFSTR